LKGIAGLQIEGIGSSRNARERFAEVPTGQHADASLRSFLKAVSYVFAIADTPERTLGPISRRKAS
jgi:hypothetical protein